MIDTVFTLVCFIAGYVLMSRRPTAQKHSAPAPARFAIPNPAECGLGWI